MRILPFALFLLTSILFSFAERGLKREIARMVVEIFKYNKPENLNSCYPNKKDFRYISTDIDNEKTKSEFLDHYLKRFENKETEINSNYSAVRNKGNTLGVIWKDLEIQNVELKREFQKNNVSYADILISLKSGNKNFVLKLDDCILSKERGWLILDEIILKE